LCQIRSTHFSTPIGKRLMPGFGLQTRAHPVRQSGLWGTGSTYIIL
jgi:hypothetical protein